MKPTLTLLTFLLLAPLAALNAADAPQKLIIGFIAEQWGEFETSFTSGRTYDNSFLDVQVNYNFRGEIIVIDQSCRSVITFRSSVQTLITTL